MAIAVDPNEKCSFCQELARIAARNLPEKEEWACVVALFNRGERARRARRVYARRKGYVR